MRYNNALNVANADLVIASGSITIDWVNVQNNETGTPHFVDIQLVSGGASYPIIQGTLTASGSARFDGPIELQDGDKIIGSCDTDGVVACQIP